MNKNNPISFNFESDWENKILSHCGAEMEVK
jgi:hypothetical protein